MRRAFSAFALVLTFTTFTTFARADEDPGAEARRHFSRGLELVDEASYAQAVAEFERAYALKPNYVVLYNIGLAHGAAGNAVAAVDALERYLAEGGNAMSATRRSDVAIELKRQRARIALIDIDVDPAGAAIRVDGVDVGTSPLDRPVRVAIGRHVISAAATGRSREESTVTVAGEEHALITLHLLEYAPPVAPAPTAPSVVSISESAPPPSPVIPREKPNRVMAITSFAIGAAFGAATLGVGIWNNGRYQDWQSNQHEIDLTRTRVSMTTGRISELAPRQADNDELIRSIHRSDGVTLGLGLAATAFVALGVVLWIVGNR